MKLSLIPIIILMFILPVVMGLDQCNEDMTTSDVPCSIISSWQMPSACNTYTIQIYNKVPVLLDIRTMDSYGSTGRCNITFNYTTVDSYLLNWSSGDSATINVKQEVDNIYYLYVVAVLLLGLLLVLGHVLEDDVFSILGGMWSVVIGVNLWRNGFPNLTNTLLIQAIPIIFAGIGFYFILAPTLKYFEEWEK